MCATTVQLPSTTMVHLKHTFPFHTKCSAFKSIRNTSTHTHFLRTALTNTHTALFVYICRSIIPFYSTIQYTSQQCGNDCGCTQTTKLPHLTSLWRNPLDIVRLQQRHTDSGLSLYK